jgi:hypothetical protein
MPSSSPPWWRFRPCELPNAVSLPLPTPALALFVVGTLKSKSEFVQVLLGSAVASCSLVAEHSPCARAFSVQFLEHLGLSLVAPFVVGARLPISVCRAASSLFCRDLAKRIRRLALCRLARRLCSLPCALVLMRIAP